MNTFDVLWDEEFSEQRSLAIAVDLSTAHVQRIHNSTVRESLMGLLERWDMGSLVRFEVPYASGLSVSDLIELRQALGFFQKLEFLDIGVDKRQAAIDTFNASERLCRETNWSFRHWSLGNFLFAKGVDAVLHRAQRKIQQVLGPVPALYELELAFGPGATTSVPKRNACQRVKLSSTMSCSANFLEVLPKFLGEVPLWRDSQCIGWTLQGNDLVEQVTVEIHDGKLAFVPKNAKTYRSVLVEPTLNTMLQGGYGRHIASRLRRVGQDIHDQSRNQRLAREGSLTGALATLDLSSASDTISSELVAHLLPIDWFLALDACRTKTYVDPLTSEVKVLEKFSSMGNGFTFPLQTLIFWALVVASQETTANVSVYGDDIICPVETVPTVLKVFAACGFKVNQSKSYWSGPFRESCGTDYYLGIDIRPFYLKRAISYEVLFLLHNFYARRHDAEMQARVLDLIPEHVRLWGPDGYGDGHLIGDWTPKHHRRESGWGGFTFETWQHLGRYFTKVMPGDRVLPAYSIYVKGEQIFDPGSVCLSRDVPPRWDTTVPMRHTKRRDGGVQLHDPLPGTRGVKKVKIYTFTAG